MSAKPVSAYSLPVAALVPPALILIAVGTSLLVCNGSHCFVAAFGCTADNTTPLNSVGYTGGGALLLAIEGTSAVANAHITITNVTAVSNYACT
jgi:hypothetical protein